MQAGSREIDFLEPLIKPQCRPQHPISFFDCFKSAQSRFYVFGVVLSGYYIFELFTEEVSLISPSGLRFICLSLDCRSPAVGPSWSVHVDDHQLVGGRLDPQSGQVSRWQPSPTLGCQGSQGFIISILFLISSLYITMSSLILNFFYFVLEDTIYFAT